MKIVEEIYDMNLDRCTGVGVLTENNSINNTTDTLVYFKENDFIWFDEVYYRITGVFFYNEQLFLQMLSVDENNYLDFSNATLTFVKVSDDFIIKKMVKLTDDDNCQHDISYCDVDMSQFI